MADAVVEPVRAVRRDGVTAGLGAWLIVGLFIDGYVHNTRGEQLESFFTPWHGVLYTGFLASALWIFLPVLQAGGPVRTRLTALPDGYAAGALGVLVFGAGGVADVLWHTFLGIEVDLQALLSPAHLLLLAGAILILTTPVRAEWRRPGQTPGLRAFFPALASVTLATLLVGFFFMYASGLYDFHATAHFAGLFEPGEELAGTPLFLRDILSSFGVTARLYTTVLLMVPALLVVRRWTPPRGTFTVLFTAYAVFMLVLNQFQLPEMVVAGLAAGAFGDLLVRRLQPSVTRLAAVRIFSAVVPAAMWTAHFALLAAVGNLGWPFEIWGGVVLFSAGTGYALGLLAFPPGLEPATKPPAHSPPS